MASLSRLTRLRPLLQVSAPMKYHLTFSVYGINPLNHPRLCFSNGNLTAQFLGKPLSLQDGFSRGNATYNRKVTLRANILNC
jgi:hypothetical protein